MERIYNIGVSQLKIVVGDITKAKTKVLACSDDASLSLGGGLSRAILNAAGNGLKQEVQKHVPATLGDVIVTSAFNLEQKYIFHIISRSFRQASTSNGEITEQEKRFILRHSVNKSFILLTDMGQDSIAFPAIGAGHAHIPYSIVAEEMAKAIICNIRQSTNPLHVEVYVYDGEQDAIDNFMIFVEQIAMNLYAVEHSQQPMQKPLLRCFMAGSTKLESERNAFRALVSRADNRWNECDIKSFDYEDFSREYKLSGHQQPYNQFIASKVDFLIFVLTDDVGNKTEEELQYAAQAFHEKGSPHICFYVKNENGAFLNGTWNKTVRKWLDDKEIYATPFDTLRELQLQVSEDLGEYVRKHFVNDMVQ